MSVMSLRLPDELSDTLASLAHATGRSKSYLALDALREYLAREAWQVSEIQQAINEADAGDSQQVGCQCAFSGYAPRSTTLTRKPPTSLNATLKQPRNLCKLY